MLFGKLYLSAASFLLAVVNIYAIAQRTVASKTTSVQALTFTVKDVGTVEVFNQSIVPGLGPRGDVVLWARVNDGQFAPVRWEDGKVQTLVIPQGYRNAFAFGVNATGTAIGWANTTLNPVDSLSTKHAFRFLAGKSDDLGTLPGGRNSEAYAISNNGIVVGISDARGNHRLGFQWTAGHMRTLPPLPGGRDTAAYGVNNKGFISGASSICDIKAKRLHMHAVIWRNGLPMDLHAADDDDDNVAYGLNSQGDAVGRITEDDENEAFLYSNRSIHRLGIQGSAFSINDHQEIVGTTDAPERGRSSGFLWLNGETFDLNRLLVEPSKARIEAAFSINDDGVILCLARFPEGMHIVLLSPSSHP